MLQIGTIAQARPQWAHIDSDSLPEWSKGVDSSSTSESCVGSNPTGVNFAGGRRKPGRSESTGLKAGEAKGGKEQKHPPWGSNPRPQG